MKKGKDYPGSKDFFLTNNSFSMLKQFLVIVIAVVVGSYIYGAVKGSIGGK